MATVSTAGPLRSRARAARAARASAAAPGRRRGSARRPPHPVPEERRSPSLHTLDGVQELHYRRAQEDDEHRGEDEEDERKQDLDRRFLCAFLGARLPPTSHLPRKVAHDLADRDSEPF